MTRGEAGVNQTEKFFANISLNVFGEGWVEPCYISASYSVLSLVNNRVKF